MRNELLPTLLQVIKQPLIWTIITTRLEDPIVIKLRKFVLATVNPDYVTTCYQSEDPMGQWFAKLKARHGQTITDEKIEARKAYKNVHKPLRFLKDAITWLDRWGTVIARA
jgi:hypothetical protein